MKHLPKEYTEADQRSDTSFLVGVAFGRAQSASLREAIQEMIDEWPADLECYEQQGSGKTPITHAPGADLGHCPACLTYELRKILEETS